MDGGARGNPGPAGIAAVLTGIDGTVIDEVGEFIGEATNNVAEYRALLLGLRRAHQLNATEVRIINDSELVARQLKGEYKVKSVGLKPLFLEALEMLKGFHSWEIRNVPREQNSDADALVNQAIDAATTSR